MNRVEAANLFAATAVAGLLFANGIPTGVPLAGLFAIGLQNFVLQPSGRQLGDWTGAILHAVLVLAALYLASMHNPRLDLLVVLLGCAVPFLALAAVVKRTVFQEFLMVLVSFLVTIGGAALAPGWAPLWITLAVILVACQTLPQLLRPRPDEAADRPDVRVRLMDAPGWWGAMPRVVSHHLGLAGIIVGILLYLVVPRHSESGTGLGDSDEAARRRRGASATAGTGSMVGLPDEVSLNDITSLRNRPGVLFTAEYLTRGVQAQPAASEVDMTLLRQTAFAAYDETRHTWEQQRARPRTLVDGWIARVATRHEIRITPVADDGAVLFVPANAQRIDGLGISIQESNGRFFASAQPERYRVEFTRAPITLEALSSAGRSAAYPELLKVPPRIRELLQSVIGPPRRRTTNEVVRHIRAFFRDFVYDMSPRTGNRPLETFLRRKRGHCELFATVTCLYLRTWGVPARLATGVRCSPSPAGDGTYRARYQDSHAWVELAVRRGFAPLDLTPGAASANQDPSEAQATAGDSRPDATANGPDDAPTGMNWSEPFSYGSDQRDVVMAWFVGVATSPVLYIALACALLTLACVVGWRAWKTRPQHSHRIRAPLGVSRRTLAFYARWLTRCQKEGFRRAPHQTPREFLRSLPTALREDGLKLTLEFERRRYGLGVK